MLLDERRECSAGWKMFPVGSARFLDTFLIKATSSDFGVFSSDERPVDDKGVAVETGVIMSSSTPKILPGLVAIVEEKPDETIEALAKHGGSTANLGRAREALTSGTWPTSGDPAEEAAAFAFYLLKHARIAERSLKGVCFEYRGQLTR